MARSSSVTISLLAGIKIKYKKDNTSICPYVTLLLGPRYLLIKTTSHLLECRSISLFSGKRQQQHLK